MSVSLRAPESVERDAHRDWVEAAEFETVMQGQRTTQLPALAMLALIAGLAFYQAPSVWLWLWLAFAGGTNLLRWREANHYRHHVEGRSVAEQLAFKRRIDWTWSASGAAWGLSPLVYFGRLSPEVEVVCWMLNAGVAGVAVVWLSAHPGVKRRFMLSFLVAVLLSVAIVWLLGLARGGQALNMWLPLALLFYWGLLYRIACGMTTLYRNSVDLRYHNMMLIQSLKAQTREAQEAVAFKDRFLAAAAHDIKQPVNALGIYADWLSTEPELAHELGPKILHATQAVNTLFDSLFDLVKFDLGRVEIDWAPVDVRRLLADLEVQFRPQAMRKGLELRVHALALSVDSDPIMLQRILSNLVSNAIRYTRSGGVLVAARRSAGGLRFEVWDSGIGIPPVEQEQVFGEFYRVQTPGTAEGFGVGLAIVKRLADLLGYRITINSRPGRGTVFRLYLPNAPVRPAGRLSARSAASASDFSRPGAETGATNGL